MKSVFLLLASLSVVPACLGAGDWIAVVAPGLEEAVTPLAERRRLANQVVFASAEVVASGPTFTVSLPLPNPAPAKPWTVRVMGKDPSLLAGTSQIR